MKKLYVQYIKGYFNAGYGIIFHTTVFFLELLKKTYTMSEEV